VCWCCADIAQYINGHSDVVGGVLVCNDDSVYERLKFMQNALGAVPAPFDCYMALRGLKTLHVRMREHEKNAMVVAQFLEQHAFVEKV
jgi:cystathionine beta-lyase/cystathionine gamma-synthase